MMIVILRKKIIHFKEILQERYPKIALKMRNKR